MKISKEKFIACQKFLTFAFVLLVGILTSCSASLQGARRMTPEESEKFQVVERISVKWWSWHFFHIPSTEKELEYEAASELRNSVIGQRYKDIEIRNIEVSGSSGSIGVVLLTSYFPCCLLFCHAQINTAYGDIVQPKYDESTNKTKFIW